MVSVEATQGPTDADVVARADRPGGGRLEEQFGPLAAVHLHVEVWGVALLLAGLLADLVGDAGGPHLGRLRGGADVRLRQIDCRGVVAVASREIVDTGPRHVGAAGQRRERVDPLVGCCQVERSGVVFGHEMDAPVCSNSVIAHATTWRGSALNDTASGRRRTAGRIGRLERRDGVRGTSRR